jgi:CBS domain-containing protein
MMLRSPKMHGASTTVADLGTFFADDHVHMALIVDGNHRLLALVERADVLGANPSESALGYGRLEGRTVSADQALLPVWDAMVVTGRRRLVVVANDGQVAGLLCLKRHRLGFCSDADVAMRLTS